MLRSSTSYQAIPARSHSMGAMEAFFFSLKKKCDLDTSKGWFLCGEQQEQS